MLNVDPAKIVHEYMYGYDGKTIVEMNRTELATYLTYLAQEGPRWLFNIVQDELHHY